MTRLEALVECLRSLHVDEEAIDNLIVDKFTQQSQGSYDVNGIRYEIYTQSEYESELYDVAESKVTELMSMLEDHAYETSADLVKLIRYIDERKAIDDFLLTVTNQDFEDYYEKEIVLESDDYIIVVV